MARENHWDETILHLATSVRHTNAISFLISRGADKEARDCHGLTPLLRSATFNSKSLTRALMQMGCDITATMIEGEWKVNFLDLVIFNESSRVMDEFVLYCPKTKKPYLHKCLDPLPKSSKEQALCMWKYFNNYPD